MAPEPEDPEVCGEAARVVDDLNVFKVGRDLGGARGASGEEDGATQPTVSGEVMGAEVDVVLEQGSLLLKKSN